MRTRRVRALLMGGQACVFYGAAEFSRDASPSRIKFWLRELRTPSLLREIAHAHPLLARRLAIERPLLRRAISGTPAQIEAALAEEERRVRTEDKAYWLPLRMELERLRHSK